MEHDFFPPEPLQTPEGLVGFQDESWRIDPKELQIFFQAEEVYWTADRTIEQWRRLLACSRLLTARLMPEGNRGGRLVGVTRVWSDHAYEAKLYDVVTAGDMMDTDVNACLIKWALRHPWVGDVVRFSLETRDRQAYYPQFGFKLGSEHETHHMRALVSELRARGLR